MIEEEIRNITFNSVWLIKKSKEDDGLQEWHQDMKHRITTTAVVTVGIVLRSAVVEELLHKTVSSCVIRV